MGRGRRYLINIMKEVMKKDTIFSGEFKAKLDILIRYFTIGPDGKNLEGIRPIPVFFTRGNGYDYILSSKGLELIIPDRPFEDFIGGSPETALDGTPLTPEDIFRRRVFDLYKVRKTGSYALLVPPEVNGGIPSIADQLLTVRLNSADNNIEEFLSNNITVSTSTVDIPSSNAALITGLNQLADVLKYIIFAQIPEGEPEVIECEPLPLPFTLLQFQKLLFCLLEELIEYLNEADAEATQLQCYVQTLSLTRCWHLSGSVFRRIANEMPRLKAFLWVDDIYGRTERRERYESNATEGCRALFREILETTLPGVNRMYFKGLTAAEGTIPGVPLASYKKNEIYIHNHGITFPIVGSKGPNEQQIYASWISGAAANPTFTDSAKSC